MPRRFFGQFLLERGKISRDALLEAVTFQREVNRSLGELALTRGMMSAEQVEEVQELQLRRDRLFGEIAIEENYLTDAEVRQLLGIQVNNYIYLGEALVEKGHLQREELERLLEEFHGETTDLEPLEVQWQSHGLKHETVTFVIVDHLRKLLYRVCGLHCKIGELIRGDLVGELPAAALDLDGDMELTLLLTFGSEGTLRLEFTEKFMGLATDDPAMIADACREFLNIVAGNAATQLSTEGLNLDLKVPRSVDSAMGDDLVVIPHHCPEGQVFLGMVGVG